MTESQKSHGREGVTAGDVRSELKPCPFCGCEPEIINCSVHCNQPFCEAQPFTAGQSASEAIAAWNRRAPEEGSAPSALASRGPNELNAGSVSIGTPGIASAPNTEGAANG